MNNLIIAPNPTNGVVDANVTLSDALQITVAGIQSDVSDSNGNMFSAETLQNFAKQHTQHAEENNIRQIAARQDLINLVTNHIYSTGFDIGTGTTDSSAATIYTCNSNRNLIYYRPNNILSGTATLDSTSISVISGGGQAQFNPDTFTNTWFDSGTTTSSTDYVIYHNGIIDGNFLGKTQEEIAKEHRRWEFKNKISQWRNRDYSSWVHSLKDMLTIDKEQKAFELLKSSLTQEELITFIKRGFITYKSPITNRIYKIYSGFRQIEVRDDKYQRLGSICIQLYNEADLDALLMRRMMVEANEGEIYEIGNGLKKPLLLGSKEEIKEESNGHVWLDRGDVSIACDNAIMVG